MLHALHTLRRLFTSFQHLTVFLDLGSIHYASYSNQQKIGHSSFSTLNRMGMVCRFMSFCRDLCQSLAYTEIRSNTVYLCFTLYRYTGVLSTNKGEYTTNK